MDLRIPKEGSIIGGRWRAGSSRETLPIENPSTGEIAGELIAANAADVDDAVTAARNALSGSWGTFTAVERGRLLSRIGAAILAQTDTLAELESFDVGKPLGQARNDVLALARYFEFYGGAADKIHGETIPYLTDYTVYTLREPYGVTGHIIPWNYPMQIIGRSVVAALAMGNAVVLKPAEQACLTALAVARIAHEQSLPEGALNVVSGTGTDAGAALASHAGLNHISFTGSPTVGMSVQAAAARNAVSVTLELGGKSPQLVFEDADLSKALPWLVNAGIQNAGQTCSAGSRILIQRSIYESVVAQLSERVRSLRAGAANANLDLGPLISARQKRSVEAYLELGARQLRLVAQGEIAPDAPAGGHYVRPALFAPVPADNQIAQEEIFGPVIVVIPFADESEAISIANSTPFGLVAGVWTRDGARQMRLAKALRAGQVFVNNYGAGGGVELPFGGVGRSGYGREKGMEGLRAFSTLKTVASYHG